MARALVTGVAGFVGSHLAEALLEQGLEVRGVDNFMPYYDRRVKERNLEGLLADTRFEFVEADIVETEMTSLLDEITVVFHQAAQAGVRTSWSRSFADYDRSNILATQRLLDGVVDRPVSRFVYASSSSVYGNAPGFPCYEDQLPRPHSPYGLTKLAGELLCGMYASNWDVPTISLRYFTVYGPRQRPDMAFHRLFEAALSGNSFPLYGDGSAIRDFTYVGDVVRANLLAMTAEARPGGVVNISGGGSVSMAETIEQVSELSGSPIELERHEMQRGDVKRTGGSNERARQLLEWSPRVPLREGLIAQLAWHREMRS